MNRAELVVIEGRLQAALVAVRVALESVDRRCHDCHRPARTMTRGADGNWRGSKCNTDYEATVGTQLALEGDGRG